MSDPTPPTPFSSSPTTSDAPRVEGLAASLARMRLLKDLPGAALDRLAGNAEERRYMSGEIIFREGSAPDDVLFVVSGGLRVVTHLKTGETVLANIGPGECVGEMGVIDGMPRSATALATAFTVLVSVPAAAFGELVNSELQVALRLVAMLSERLQRTNAFVAELPSRPIRVDQTLEP